jgi:hypothetical protein
MKKLNRAEKAQKAQFVTEVTNLIIEQFYCPKAWALDTANGLHTMFEKHGYKIKKKKISPSTADAGLIQFSNN